MSTDPHPVNHVGWSLIVMNINIILLFCHTSLLPPKQFFLHETLQLVRRGLVAMGQATPDYPAT